MGRSRLLRLASRRVPRRIWDPNWRNRSTLYRLQPPPCPSHHVVGPPDFVGMGAQKAGTSWWYDLITKHPDVYDNQRVHKERHYFDHIVRHSGEPPTVDSYSQWFDRPPGFITGEWTPRYMYDWWVPEQLAHTAPQTKVLVLLRNPVDRYFSGLSHWRRRNPRRSDPPAEIVGEAFARGLYFDQLQRIGEFFDGKNVLVLQFEQCVQSPEESLRRTFEFLNLPRLCETELLSGENSVRPPDRVMTNERDQLARAYESSMRALFKHSWVAEFDPHLW